MNQRGWVLLLFLCGHVFAAGPAKPVYEGTTTEDWSAQGGGGSVPSSGVGGPVSSSGGDIRAHIAKVEAMKRAEDAKREKERVRLEKEAEEVRKFAEMMERQKHWFAEEQKRQEPIRAARLEQWNQLRQEFTQIEDYASQIRRENRVIQSRERAYYAGTNLLHFSKTSFETDVSRQQVENGLEYYQGLNKIALCLLDISIGLNPVTGLGQSGYEFFIGKNLITGEKLGSFERSVAFAGILSAGAIPKIYKMSLKLWHIIDRYQKTYSSINKFKNATHINKVVTEGAQIAKALEELKQGQPITQTIATFPPESLNVMIKNVEVLNQIRKGYVAELKAASEQLVPLATAGQPLSKIAEWASYTRRNISTKYKDLTPQPFRSMIYERNLGKAEYKDPLGPTFEMLIKSAEKKGLTGDQIYERIIHSSFKPNDDLSHFLEKAAQILGK